MSYQKIFNATQFLSSAATLAGCPDDDYLEIAFAGRSNAGKSSSLNAICSKKIAKTSKTPGRTQLINFFQITDNCRLVDLPGYGYAKVPMSLKEYWQLHLSEYLTKRNNLQGLILLVDIRHLLTEFDRTMLEWAMFSQKPVHILLTKSDKLGFGAAKNQLISLERLLVRDFSNINVSAQLFSSLKNVGIEGARIKILQMLQITVGVNEVYNQSAKNPI